MFSNYPQIDGFSTRSMPEEDLSSIKALFTAQLESMFEQCDIAISDDFFTRFPDMKPFLVAEQDGNSLTVEAKEKIVAAILASYLHRIMLDVNSRELAISFKIYEEVLDEMGHQNVGTYFLMLDNYYRANRNDAYGKHGWQIAKMILFGSADNTSLHGFLNETSGATTLVGNTILAAGLLAQLAKGQDYFLDRSMKRDVIIEFAAMFDIYFETYPPKYAR